MLECLKWGRKKKNPEAFYHQEEVVKRLEKLITITSGSL